MARETGFDLCEKKNSVENIAVCPKVPVRDGPDAAGIIGDVH